MISLTPVNSKLENAQRLRLWDENLQVIIPLVRNACVRIWIRQIRRYIAISTLNSPRSLGKFILHPLIYTLLVFKLAQDVEKKKAELKNPHFLSLNQNIVAWSQEEKCGVCNAH